MLDERKRRVLHAIVHDYIHTAEPVGSRAIVRRHGLQVSSATVRNEMADLEELGYLEQPHTSAGRIPSYKGYRYYVDELMEQPAPTQEQIASVRRLYENHLREIDAILMQAVRVLSETTDYLAVAEGPQIGGGMLHLLQLVRLRPGRALMMIVTDDGLVDHRLIDIQDDLNSETLERIARVLTAHLAGFQVGELRRHVLKALSTELHEYRAVVEQALSALEAKQADDDEPRFLFGGAGNIFKQPEFRDVERAHALLSLLGEQKIVRELLGHHEPAQDSGVQVMIGPENPVPALQDCSVVTATYVLDGRQIGRIAVIGPTRMNYPAVVPFVELVTESLSEVLARRLGF